MERKTKITFVLSIKSKKILDQICRKMKLTQKDVVEIALYELRDILRDLDS